MKVPKRTTKHRFLGGFIGGVLGILTLGYLFSILAPVSIIIGFISGFYYDVIGIKVYEYLGRVSFKFVAVFRLNKMKASRSLAKLRAVFSAERTYGIWKRMISFCANCAKILSGFNFIGRWLSRHPMNRAYLIRGIAIVSFLISVIYSSYLLGVFEELTVVAEEEPPVLFLIWFFAIFTSTSMSLGLSFERSEDKTKAIGQYYQEFERYMNKGSINFFIHDFIKLYKVTVMVSLSLISKIIYWGVAGLTYLLLALVPVIILFGIMKVALITVLKLAKLQAHWLGVLVTFMVMTLSAYLFSDYMQPGIALWLVAFSTGIISGVATEAVYHLAEKTISIPRKVFRIAATPIVTKKRMAWANQLILKYNSRTDDLFPNFIF